MYLERAPERVLLVAVCLVLALVAGCGRDKPRTESAADSAEVLDQIAYVSGLIPDIWIMNADGTGNVQVTSDLGFFGINGLAWSPDGTRFAFAAHKPQGDAIYIMDVDGQDLQQLTPLTNSRTRPGPGYPAWSPDGKRIAYEASDFSVHVMSADGSHDRAVGRAFLGGTWSPDSKRLLVADEASGQQPSLFIIPSTGGVGWPLNVGFALQGAWSPDGRRIAFAPLVEGQTRITVAKVDGTDAQQITNREPGQAERRESFPAWSPDGRRITFQVCSGSPCTGTDSEIMVINADGTGIMQLTFDGLNEYPVWRPHGSSKGK